MGSRRAWILLLRVMDKVFDFSSERHLLKYATLSAGKNSYTEGHHGYYYYYYYCFMERYSIFHRNGIY